MTNMRKELIELLIEGKFEEFTERAQSFIDQMPKSRGASSAPAKKYFITGQYLGMFSSLKDTKIYNNLGISKISFKFDDTGNLNIVLSQGKESRQQKIFVFTQKEDAEIEGVLKSYKQSYNGYVCVVNVHGQQVRLEGSALNNNYQVQRDLIDISRTEGGSSNQKLEKYISDIQVLGSQTHPRIRPIEELFKYSSILYKNIRDSLPEKHQKSFNVEAFQHGFITGELMNFRYRSNLKTNLELISGQGYVDMFLLIRGNDRSQSAVPIIVELKRSNSKNALYQALKEAEWYAKGMHSNKMRVITNSENVFCAGLDLNDRGVSLSTQKIETPKQPFLQTLLGSLDDDVNNNYDKIKDMLSEVHYSFPSTEGMYGYLSKFILGQSLIIDKVNKKTLNGIGVFKHTSSSYLDTFFFQVEEKLLVLNVNSQDENRPQTRQKSKNTSEGILPVDQIKKQGTNIKDVVEVDISGAYGSKAEFSPGQHFHREGAVEIRSSSLQDYLSGKMNAEGDPYDIKSKVENLKKEFNAAVDYQHNRLGDLIGDNLSDVQKVDMQAYQRLFNAISEEIYNNNKGYFFDDLKGKEYQHKAFLDGILTGLSDINSDKLKVLVPTEFQVGKGKRVDIAIQTVGKDGKQGTPVLIELKKGIKKNDKRFLDAEKQLTEYLKSPNIKSITDGKQAAGFVVALSTKKGTSAEGMIQISDKLTVSPVVHSSIIDPRIPSSSKSSSSQKLCIGGKTSRRKREALFRSCISTSLTKEDIQKISKGKGVEFDVEGADIEIDRRRFEIDSEEFIKRSKIFEDAIGDAKYEDMIKLSNSVEITGNFKNQVKSLITNRKIINGFEKIGKTADIGNYVILGKDVLSNIANGNYDRVAIGAGMLAGQHGLGKLSKHVATKGANLIKSGSKVLGTSIKLSSSFIPNAFTMPLDIKNLIDSIEGCEKGDHDSCVGAVENSIYIAEGVVQTGIMVGIATGAISSSGAGVASIVFPVGTAVVVVTAIGSQVYIAVHRANEIDKVMPLTTGEWWNEAWRSFTFREVSEDVTKLMREKEFNNQVVADVVEWLKSNKNFQSIVVPSMGVRIDRKEVFQECDFIEKVFFNSLFYPNAGCKSLANNPGYYKRVERIVYVPEIKQDNSASFDQKVKVIWSRTAPDFPTEGSVMCAPEGEGGGVLDEGYRCKDAIAVEYTHSRTGDDAIFKLLDGNDEANGFRDRKNVFIINNGHKTITGGNKSDDFVFLGSDTTGIIRGLNGDDAVFMEGFISGNERLFAYFEEEKSKLLYSSPNVQNPRLEVEMYNINRFYGRSDRPDRAIIVCGNNINTIDLLGGGREDVMLNTSSSELWDEIYIAENSNKVFSYKLNLAIHRYTSVINKASGGEFFYLVKPIDKHRSYGGVSRMELHGSSVHNIFFEESRLFDIDVISFDRSDGIYNITVKFYVMSRSKEDVIYRHTNHTVNNWSECEAGHFCLNIQSQSIENLKLMLSDGTFLNLEEKRLYVTYPIEISDVTSKYSKVARELGWSVFAKSNANRCVSIGNGDNNLLYNKVEGCVNYLVGNGGNNTYVIISGYNKLNPNTKIPRIIIDRVDSGEQTLILSDLISQIRKDLHTKVISLIHKDNDDLLFKIRLSGYHFDLLEIRMQGALIDDSYKRWKVVLNDIPMRLVRDGSSARLGILPLVYTDHDSDIVDILKNAKKIYSEDLQDTKELNVSDRGIGNYGFARNGNDLILSNLFNSKEGQNYAIVFVDFYLLEEQFIDATIVFSDSKSISIRDRISEQLKDVTYNGFSLYQASKEGDLDEVTFLLEEGASVDFRDDDGYTPLHYAAGLANLAVVEKLVEKGADFNAQSFTERRTPLHEAAYYNKIDIVKFLVSAGADVNIQDKHGITPLGIAKASERNDVVKYLEKIDAGHLIGKRAIHFAAEENSVEAIQYLLDTKRERLDERDNNGLTPLHYAAILGNLAAVKKLVEEGADFDAQYFTERRTPLHEAAYCNKIDIVKFLVSAGADVNIQDKHGITPLGIAAAAGNYGIVEYLQQEGSVDSKIPNTVEKPLQRKHRHHHGDHDYHHIHLSRKPLSIEQPEVVASSGTRPSSWINDLFNWVTSSIDGIWGSKPALPKETSSTPKPISQVDAQTDINGTILLLDMIVRRSTGQKYISTAEQPISPLEAQGYALNITEGFEKVVKQAGLKSGVLMRPLNIDFVEIQKEVKGKIISGKFNEISGVLKSSVEGGFLDGEAGKLTPKKFDKFMIEFDRRLNVVLDQPMQQMLYNGDGRLEVNGAKKHKVSLEPQSYLSNTSVQGHLTQDRVLRIR